MPRATVSAPVSALARRLDAAPESGVMTIVQYEIWLKNREYVCWSAI
jgi:hypothetical protein